MKIIRFAFLCFVISSCGESVETISPSLEPITSSVYASEVLKSKDQYEAYAAASGIVKQIFVKEGDTVKKGQPLLMISNEVRQIKNVLAKFNGHILK